MEIYKRKCPECTKEICYSLKQSYKEAESEKRLCKSCAKKGKKNSFHGKHHKKSSMKQMIKTKKTSKVYKKYLKKLKSKEHREKMSKSFSGDKNPAYKRGTLKSVWEKKYGKEIAEEKNKEWKKKLSKLNAGKNNKMYGKPSPQGSGNGWSGWYNGWFFRSLRELSYMVNIIDRFKLKWENGELKKFKIEYIDWDGKKRNYFPDFIIENKYMIECKPKRLHSSVGVQSKAKFAKKFCKKHELIYKLTEPRMLTYKEVYNLYINKKIKFTDKYEKKFLEKYNNI